MIDLPNNIPIFPLRGALLLPTGSLPLNIFEPRYLSMVDYALSHEKLIGMIQPKTEYSEELYKIGCVGKITNYSETTNNRYLINLTGISKFKIISEIKKIDGFKLFNVEYKKSYSNFNRFDNKIFDKKTFINKIKIFFKKKDLNLNDEQINSLDDKYLIIISAMICPFEASEKQAMLECENLNSLSKTILNLIEFYLNKSHKNETIN